MSNTDIIKGVYQAFAEGDIPGVLAAMHPNIEWNEAENFPYADGNPYKGPQAILDGVFMRLGSEWENFAAVPDHMFGPGDDIVLVLGRYSGTVRATGKSVDAQFAHVWWLIDGRITRFQQYTDTAQVRDAMSA